MTRPTMTSSGKTYEAGRRRRDRLAIQRPERLEAPAGGGRAGGVSGRADRRHHPGEDHRQPLRTPRHGGQDRPVAEAASGLSKLCYASCKDILTRDQALVLRTVGYLSDGIIRQIEDYLKSVLELP